jgi:hypothetical protein
VPVCVECAKNNPDYMVVTQSGAIGLHGATAGMLKGLRNGTQITCPWKASPPKMYLLKDVLERKALAKNKQPPAKNRQR